MNYYIQGDKEKAGQIKSAFEKILGRTVDLPFEKESVFFYTVNIQGKSCIRTFDTTYYLVNIIKTHPDYKELELPVEPKFNDGDVLVTTNIRSCPFIYRKPDFNNDLAYYYVGIDGNGKLSIGWPKRTLCHFGLIADAVIAGQGQRDRLFAKMKEAGYQWDADKKELRKIKPHYDIDNFKPFDKVLMRFCDGANWCCALFSHYCTRGNNHFVCSGCSVTQCIPFNDDTKHLLGTTDMCDEQYINW